MIILSIASILALAVLRVGHYIIYKTEEHVAAEQYIFDKDFPDNQNKPDSTCRTYLPDGKVSSETLNFFRFLERRFTVQSVKHLDDHFNAVETYLFSHCNESDAQRLFEIYKKHLQCQIELGTNPHYRAKTVDAKLLLALLYKIQNFRREKLGKETADALFGREVKEREYLLRRAIIIDDNTLYGKDKEGRLQKLKHDMWNDEAISIGEDNNTYNRYQLKLRLYQKDLSELDEERRKLTLERFRKEFFSQDEIERLHKVDQRLAKEKEKMERYRAAEQKILNTINMTQEEKNKRIRALQDEIFGEEAEAFRRREIIYGGTEN